MSSMIHIQVSIFSLAFSQRADHLGVSWLNVCAPLTTEWINTGVFLVGMFPKVRKYHITFHCGLYKREAIRKSIKKTLITTWE